MSAAAALIGLIGGVPAGLMLGNFTTRGMAVIASRDFSAPPRLYADRTMRPAVPDDRQPGLVKVVSIQSAPADARMEMAAY